MSKDTTHQEKFQLLDPWLPSLISAIKKDLKSDHLKNDPKFTKQTFPGKNPNKLTQEELIHAYQPLLKSCTEELGEFVSNRWLLKNSDIYYFFEERMQKISPNFTELEELESSEGKKLMDEAILEFGAEKTYIFSILNAVVFPKVLYSELRNQAENETTHQKDKKEKEVQEKNLQQSLKKQEEEYARMVNRYEKKILGLLLKYDRDTELLKKEIQALKSKAGCTS